MTKEIYISSTPHETRLAIVEDEQLVEIHYERENEYSLAGSMYKGKVTRVLPGMQSAFVDIGLERDAFLYVTDFLEEQDDSGEFERTTLPAPRVPREETTVVDGATRSADGQTSPASEGAEESAAEGEAKRFGRRRGRRRGAKEREPLAPAAESADTERLTQGVTLEINSDDFDEASFASPTPAHRASSLRAPSLAASSLPASSLIEDGEEENYNLPDRSAASLEEPSDDWFSPEPLPEDSAAQNAPEEEQHAEDRTRDTERGGRRSRRERDDSDRGNDEGFAGHSSQAQPFVLPGESLSKYSAKTQAQAHGSEPSKSSTVTAKPSTMMEAPISWDGGATLPGESLSRHRGSAKQNAKPQGRQQKIQSTPSHQIAEASPFAVDPMDPTAEQYAELQADPHAEPTEPIAIAIEEDEFSHDENVEESESLVHDEMVHSRESEGHQRDSRNGFEEPVQHEVTDLEVEPDASASHRYDPNPPREFRLPWSKKDKQQKKEDVHDPHTGTSEADRQRREQAHQQAHEFASHPSVTAEVFPGVPDFVEESDDADGDGNVHSADRHFAPGAGHVDEEMIDEEESDFEPFREGEEEDHGDLVEETMEHNGADVGEFVHDTYATQSGAAFETSDEAEPGTGQHEDLSQADGTGADGHATAAAGRQRRGRRGRRGERTSAQKDQNETSAAAKSEPREERQADRDGDRPERRNDRGNDRANDRGNERGDSDRGRAGRQTGRRQSMQSQSLPAISELLKPGQEILVQIAKEPIAKKGARITSHIALPGRFLVYMPTVNHVGVSRKIASEEERQRLKRVLLSEKAEASGGFIVRTAAGNATEQELRSDIRFLINLWTDIKQRSDTAKPPALIYHDLSLVERILRDQVTDKFSAIWVDTEAEYERVVRFLNRFQPSLVRHVKLYTKETPLFEQFGLQEEVNRALKSKVWLKSGGSIVINQTEALVAIDINTGKFVGKTSRLEDTILRTNLDAIPEIVRQVRLRDLGGIIVIDFIDMDERRNRHKVMAALEEELKRDRAPSKVLQFNDFGLVAITRKRVKQSLERTLSMPCITCQGTGMVKNPTTVCNEVFVELRKMHKHLERGDVMLRVHPEVVKQLKTNGSRWLQDMEEMAGRTIIIKSDASIHPEQFDIH